jgi:hypothetical protein
VVERYLAKVDVVSSRLIARFSEMCLLVRLLGWQTATSEAFYCFRRLSVGRQSGSILTPTL